MNAAWRSTPALFVLCISMCLAASTTPIQLIYPDAEHQNLLINEEAVKVLESISQPVSVISGKSPSASHKLPL